MKTAIEALLEIERALSKEKGPFTLFALFLRAEALEKWDLVVSAPWIEKDKRSALKLLSDRVQASLSVSDLLSISRIVLADPSDPAVDAINRSVRVEHSTVEVRDSTFFGQQIRHAHIFASKRQPMEVRQRTPGYAARRKRRERRVRK
jgi:hypothetical protein